MEANQKKSAQDQKVKKKEIENLKNMVHNFNIGFDLKNNQYNERQNELYDVTGGVYSS